MTACLFMSWNQFHAAQYRWVSDKRTSAGTCASCCASRYTASHTVRKSVLHVPVRLVQRVHPLQMVPAAAEMLPSAPSMLGLVLMVLSAGLHSSKLCKLFSNRCSHRLADCILSQLWSQELEFLQSWYDMFLSLWVSTGGITGMIICA